MMNASRLLASLTRSRRTKIIITRCGRCHLFSLLSSSQIPITHQQQQRQRRRQRQSFVEHSHNHYNSWTSHVKQSLFSRSEGYAVPSLFFMQQPPSYPPLISKKHDASTTSAMQPSFQTNCPRGTKHQNPTQQRQHPPSISASVLPLFQVGSRWLFDREQRQSSKLWAIRFQTTMRFVPQIQPAKQQLQRPAIRWMSGDSPQNKDNHHQNNYASLKDHETSLNAPNHKAEPISENKPAVSSTITQTASAEETSSSSSQQQQQQYPNIKVISASEHPVQQRIRAYVNDLNLTDQVSVILIATFTAIVLLAPYAIRHMKEHSDSWHERLHTDDPVDELANLARAEWSIIDNNNGENEQQQKNLLENILKDVFQSKALQHAAQDFVVQILQSERFQQAVSRLVKELWNDLVTDPETVAQVIQLLEVAIQDPKIKAAVQELVVQVFVREPEVRDALIRTIESLGEDPTVRAAVIQLLTDATHATLNDPEILDHSMEFATDVVGDDIVQQTAGDALRKSFKHAVLRPATAVFLTAIGVGLIIFSIFAVGYSRSSEQEAVLLETAARSLRFNVSFGIVRILTWPLRQFQRVFSRATGSILPAVESIGNLIERSVDRALKIMAQVVLQALSLPLMGIRGAGEWILKSMGRMIHHLFENVQKQRRNAHASLVAAMSSFIAMCWSTVISWAGKFGERSAAWATGVSTLTTKCWKGMIAASSNCLMIGSSYVVDWVSRMLQRLDKVWRSSEKDTWEQFE